MKGYEFWLGFIQNNATFKEYSTIVFISSDQHSSGTVSLPRTNWSATFTVTPGNITSVIIPTDITAHTISGAIKNKGILVRSNKPVNVFAGNSSPYTTDGSLILPLQFLKSSYWVITYEGFNKSRNDLLVVSPEDGTVVEITPACETENGHPANIPFTVNLNEGQTYYLRSKENGDLTGTRIKATEGCKPLAVFSGSKGSNIPSHCIAVDHIFHQMIPDEQLGRQYLLSPVTGSYTCRILATENNTQVSLGHQQITLNKGQTREVNNISSPFLINSDKPLLVAQYLEGTYCANQGDPGMAIIPPVEQFYNECSFITPPLNNIDNHFVNIITKKENAGKLKLNGAIINQGFTPMAVSTDYVYLRLKIDPGVHTLAGDFDFMATVSGLGWANSYFFTAAFKEELHLEVDYKKKVCTDIIENFTSDSNKGNTWSWDFGDNTSASGKNVSHAYKSPGNYRITLSIEQNEGCPVIFRDYIEVLAFPAVDLPRDTMLCGDHTLKLYAGGINQTASWSTGETTPSIKTNQEGLFIVETTNGVCSRTDSVNVIRTPYPQPVEISPDTTIYINNSAMLYASGGSSFKWSPPVALSCTNCPNPYASPTETTTYYIEVWDKNGCMALDSVKVTVDKDLKVFVPNIFSPNNDGINDVLYVRGKGIRSLKFLVFNRWGEKVFESESTDFGWDGTYRGKALSPSVFVYYVDAILESGERILKKGDVTLIR